MTATGFALLVLLGFVLPAPILVWLDRPRPRRGSDLGDKPEAR